MFSSNPEEPSKSATKVCKRCNGSGNIEKEYKCCYCESGWKQSDCRRCHRGICKNCNGTCVILYSGQCKKCNGMGKYPPIGKWQCNKCNGIGIACSKCNETGRYPVEIGKDPCNNCNGSGI